MVEEYPEFPPEVVAIYCGDKKPENSSQFLKQFIDELGDLMDNGLIVNGFTLSIKVKCVICDSPARAFIKGEIFKRFRYCIVNQIRFLCFLWQISY